MFFEILLYFLAQEVKVGTWEEALKTLDPPPPNPGWHGADHVKYVETSEMDKEFGHKINVPGNTIWSFVNKDKLNRCAYVPS